MPASPISRKAQRAPPLHPLAVDRCEIGLEEDRQLPGAVKRVRGVQLVDAVLDRHLLRRWRNRLIVQAAPADAEQVGLGGERQGVSGLVKKRAALGVAQDGNLFFRNVTWVVSRPISAYSSSSCLAWAAWASTRLSRFSNTTGNSLTA